jgi:hypothetical protein
LVHGVCGSFGGRVLYHNPEYVAPNMMRRLQKQQAAGKYKYKVRRGIVL